MSAIAIIDDHQLFASGLASLFKDLIGDYQLDCYTSARDFLEKNRKQVALIILDFYLPGSYFVETFAELKQHYSCPFLVVSASPSPSDRIEAQRAGAIAFVSKNMSPEELLNIVNLALAGECISEVKDNSSLNLADFDLTRRQVEILLLVSKGCSNKEIANLIGVSPETVKSHLKTIYRRINVEGRIEAVEFIRQHGVI